ncbi:hypothetical protein [Solirubrobacter soli]|uniref:hypothetical protein n=1 Tax=Solirubrobacter soli TaxID=363832 RepID=UPI00146E67D6|nr:hypothetical protein [Solirubrobacter soli]
MATVAAGKVTFTVTNDGAVTHEYIVLKTSQPAAQLPVSGGRASEAGHVSEIGDLPVGKTKTVTLDLKPGHYSIICNPPGHYLGGMHADLTVSDVRTERHRSLWVLAGENDGFHRTSRHHGTIRRRTPTTRPSLRTTNMPNPSLRLALAVSDGRRSRHALRLDASGSQQPGVRLIRPLLPSSQSRSAHVPPSGGSDLGESTSPVKFAGFRMYCFSTNWYLEQPLPKETSAGEARSKTSHERSLLLHSQPGSPLHSMAAVVVPCCL